MLSRQKKAELLKKMTDVAVRMSEEQLVELRADIKVNAAFCDRLSGPASTADLQQSGLHLTSETHGLPSELGPFPDFLFL